MLTFFFKMPPHVPIQALPFHLHSVLLGFATWSLKTQCEEMLKTGFYKIVYQQNVAIIILKNRGRLL